MGLDEPAKAVTLVPANPSDFLVGHHDQDQVAGRGEALPFQRSERDGRRRDLVAHVECSPPPHLTVDEVARPQVAIPLGGVSEHRVRVRENASEGPPPPGIRATRLARCGSRAKSSESIPSCAR